MKKIITLIVTLFVSTTAFSSQFTVKRINNDLQSICMYIGNDGQNDSDDDTGHTQNIGNDGQNDTDDDPVDLNSFMDSNNSIDDLLCQIVPTSFK